MAKRIVECVPNFSEGSDKRIIQAISDAGRGISGARVLGIEPDADYNRTVLTIAGEPEAVSEAAFRVIKAAFENIDMRTHQGEHPRIGAVDVCPFVPLEGVTMTDCANLSRELAIRVSDELGLCTFLYGAAATNPERELLSDLRRGQYESLEGRLSDGGPHLPDFGPLDWNENTARFGAVVIGARQILVAYNVNVDETDASASKIAGSLVRSTGRLLKKDDGRKTRIPGMLPMVQGMGLPLEAHGISQVSMNLRDVSITPMHIAFEAVRSIVKDHGVDTCGSELVGLVPLSAMIESGKWYANEGCTDEAELVAAAINGLGLDYLGPFSAKERIIEWALRTEESE
ncbi:MAG: glutamate formimidoyltransferase [Euryarchaeota archaeon]|jgi:glutamate formiminotransferase/formiminotetrahydrofolate cyclodeaminase|nr:glutamate formimidoyltransferase [Euryarchaeota archaeon]MBT4981965.1 glutamate formimidoyltransferase [Euryarchaeota archaeon]MBT5185029.1 glutamate formimidoyltransferase [Euryarchaeota archaeon]